MYDIIICSLSAKYPHMSLAPWCLFSSIKKNVANCNALVYENTINSDFGKTLNELISYNSQIYAFSCYIWNISIVLKLCKEIKNELPGAIILLGGPEVSYNADEILSENNFVDFLISGEGEIPICEFLTEFFGKKAYKNVSGLCFVGRIAEPFITDIEPASPYCEEFFQRVSGRILYIETTRGCPYSCAFCLSGRCGGVRYFSLDRVFAEIISLANSGTKTIKFVDRTFNANAERANTILSFIIENSGKTFKSDVCFHFEIAGDILRESTFEILESAPRGLFQLEIGMQTFNEKTLEYINRKTNTKKLTENIKRLISFGNMHIHVDLIAGLPFEGIESFEETFLKAYSLGADMLQLGFLKMLHGSPMREETERYPCEYSKYPPYEVIKTPWLSNKDLALLKRCEDALERLYNSGRFLCVLDYLINELSANPFKLFCEFGTFVDADLSLDGYSKTFFEWILHKFDIETGKLRDLFVIDRLSSNSSGKLPAFLKKEGMLYKKIKKYLKHNMSLTGFAVLSDEKTAVFQDKKSPCKQGGRFNLIYKELSEDML